MDVLTIIRAIAVVCPGLLADIFLGYRAGPQHALQKLSPSSFVQFQQVVRVHYVKFMPPLNITASLTTFTSFSRLASVAFSPVSIPTRAPIFTSPSECRLTFARTANKTHSLPDSQRC